MRRQFIARMAALLAALGIWTLTGQSALGAFSWANITHNGNVDVGAQISMTISEGAAANTADIKFQNIGTISSIITDIAFDPGAFGAANFTFASLTDSAGVDIRHVSSYNLPGGNTLTPKFAEAQAFKKFQNVANGINNVAAKSFGESLTLTFALGANHTFQDVINSINNGEFRVGVHVQSVAPQGGSDTYVIGAVPEPGTFLAGILLLAPLGAAALRQMRRRA